jgi:hypothetical protein
MYLDTIVRYLPYFMDIPDFTIRICQIFFSDKGLRSNNHLAASKSAYLFVRLCERIVNMGLKKEERAGFPIVMNEIRNVIDQYYTG